MGLHTNAVGRVEQQGNELRAEIARQVDEVRAKLQQNLYFLAWQLPCLYLEMPFFEGYAQEHPARYLKFLTAYMDEINIPMHHFKQVLKQSLWSLDLNREVAYGSKIFFFDTLIID